MVRRLNGNFIKFIVFIVLILILGFFINRPEGTKVQIQTTYKEKPIKGVISTFNYQEWVEDPDDTTLKILDSNIIISGRYVEDIKVLRE